SVAAVTATTSISFCTNTARTEIYTLSLHDALPISPQATLTTCNPRSFPIREAKVCSYATPWPTAIDSPETTSDGSSGSGAPASLAARSPHASIEYEERLSFGPRTVVREGRSTQPNRGSVRPKWDSSFSDLQ